MESTSDMNISVTDLAAFAAVAVKEADLNCLLANAEDLKILKVAFLLKWTLIKTKVQISVDFSVIRLLEKYEDVDIDGLCTVLRYSCEVHPSEGPAREIFTFVKNRLPDISDDEEDCMRILKLLNVTSKTHKLLFENFIRSSELQPFIYKLLKHDSKIVRNFLVTHILPHHLRHANSIADEVLHEILLQAMKSQDLFILCSVIDYLELDFLTDPNLWLFIQKCLVAGNNTICYKQSVHFLKSTNYIISPSNYDRLPEVLKFNIENIEIIRKAWENYFTLLEIIQETQVHLITPLIFLLKNLKVLHPSWSKCIYEILLSHSSNAIIAEVANIFFESDEVNLHEDLLGLVMKSLNKIEASDEFFDKFNKYLEKLSEEKFVELLQQVAEISWTPVSLYKFMLRLSGRRLKFLPELILNLIFTVRKVTNVGVRIKLMSLLERFIKYTFFYEGNFQFADYLKIAPHLTLEVELEGFIKDIEAEIQSWKENKFVDEHKIAEVMKIVFKLECSELLNLLVTCIRENQFGSFTSDLVIFHFIINEKSYFSDSFLSSYIDRRFENLENKENIEYLLKIIDGTNVSNFIFAPKTLEIISPNENLQKAQVSFKIILKMSAKTLGQFWTPIFMQHDFVINEFIVKSFLNTNIFEEEILYDIVQNICETQSDNIFSVCLDNFQKQITVTDLKKKFVELFLYRLKEVKDVNAINSPLRSLMQLVFNLNVETIFDVMEQLLKLYRTYKITSDLLDVVLNNITPDFLPPQETVRFYNKLAPFLTDILLQHWITSKEMNEIDLLNDDSRYNKCTCGPMINVLQITLKIANEMNRKNYIDEFILHLFKEYRKGLSKRYFNNSQPHIQKLRILQIILTIHSHLSRDQSLTLFNILIDSLCKESHQPSVKFLIQWTLIKLVATNMNLFERLTETLKTANRMHTSSIISIVSIIYHLCLLNANENFWMEVYKIMLPWTAGAHFNLRFHTQTALKKLYEEALKLQFKNIEKEMFVSNCAIVDVLKGTQREIGDIDAFFFDKFDPLKHYSIETIFVLIPQLTEVVLSEWHGFKISLEKLAKFVHFKVRNGDDDFEAAVQAVKIKSNENKVVQFFEDAYVQKKIVPFEIPVKNSDIIVIATLVDKASNLGGLSRTCEIFNVKELVVNSVAVTKQKEFQSLSMTSENWMNITEVKQVDLKNYLLELKESDYIIFGVEQATKSVQLNCCKFPKKSAFLLGSENKGIPPFFLALMDECIEIPQFGTIRSLNVHVAASVCIWEYAKQHM